jgi:hypothetical protein
MYEQVGRPKTGVQINFAISRTSERQRTMIPPLRSRTSTIFRCPLDNNSLVRPYNPSVGLQRATMESYMVLFIITTAISVWLLLRRRFIFVPTISSDTDKQQNHGGVITHDIPAIDSIKHLLWRLWSGFTSGSWYDTNSPTPGTAKVSKRYKRIRQLETGSGKHQRQDGKRNELSQNHHTPSYAFVVQERRRFDYPPEDVDIEILSDDLKKALRRCLQHVDSVHDQKPLVRRFGSALIVDQRVQVVSRSRRNQVRNRNVRSTIINPAEPWSTP